MQLEPIGTIFHSCKAVLSLDVLGLDGLNQSTDLLGLSSTSSLSFPSNPCHVPEAQWHLSPHASLTCAASGSLVSWLSALCWQVTDKKNIKLFLLSPYPFQKHVSVLAKDSRWMPADIRGRQASCPVLAVSGHIHQKVFLHRIDFTAHRSYSYHQWAREPKYIFSAW